MDSYFLDKSCNIGKYRRLRHIFSDEKKCLIVPLDDSLISGPVKGLKHLDDKIKQIVSANPSALITYLGSASLAKEYNIPIILNISSSTTLSNHTNKVLISSVEQAVAIDADAVALHMNFSSKYESSMLKNIVEVKQKCDYYGMPLMILAYPRTEKYEGSAVLDDNYEDLKGIDPNAYAEKVCHCVRIAFELGADIIKTHYTGSAETFKKVIDCAQGVPVVIAGGVEIDDNAVFKMVKSAMDAGAAGVSIGRNVFDKSNSDYMIQKISELIY